jgi:erythronate-4-phosphate dehydrogenase
MRIVADANITYVEDAFAALGEVVALPSAELTRERVRDADLLLTRSTVKVNGQLLDGSRVRFVGTATIGIDHLDTQYLDGRGIRWAAAPGSNADSVVQWLAAALGCVRDLPRRQLGIVGVGNVGSRVERLWRALDVPPPLLCDPPRARQLGHGSPGGATGGPHAAATDFVALDEILARCDLVSLHVPLTRDGEDATYHLIDARKLRRDAVLINACRGEVLDTATTFAVDNPLLLDVFAGEPRPDPRLVARAMIATPHIAGHSLDGKANGTQMIYDAACAFLGVAPTWHPRDALPPPPGPVVVRRREDGVAAVLEAVAADYDILADDKSLRKIVDSGDDGRQFRHYREHYPERRELDGRTVKLAVPLVDTIRMLNAYGVAVAPL